MRNLGRIYDVGEGVVVDKTQARQWYEKAAEAGDGDAMVVVADRIIEERSLSDSTEFERLQSIEQLEKARQWLKNAADNGNLKAKASLPNLDSKIAELKSRL